MALSLCHFSFVVLHRLLQAARSQISSGMNHVSRARESASLWRQGNSPQVLGVLRRIWLQLGRAAMAPPLRKCNLLQRACFGRGVGLDSRGPYNSVKPKKVLFQHLKIFILNCLPSVISVYYKILMFCKNKFSGFHKLWEIFSMLSLIMHYYW